MLYHKPVRGRTLEKPPLNDADKPNGNSRKSLLDFIQFFSQASTEDRSAKVAQLSDAQLAYYYQALHAPAISDNRWLPLLEAEIKRRGLILPS
jgi:hypothetical protein